MMGCGGCGQNPVPMLLRANEMSDSLRIPLTGDLIMFKIKEMVRADSYPRMNLGMTAKSPALGSRVQGQTLFLEKNSIPRHSAVLIWIRVIRSEGPQLIGHGVSLRLGLKSMVSSLTMPRP